MMPLIITPEVEAEVARVRTFAEQPENRRTAANAHIPGNQVTYSMVIPAGFKAVYSVDEGTRPGLWFRHLSVSVFVEADRAPSHSEMQMIISLFGFTPKARVGLLPADGDLVVHALESFEEASD